MKNITLTLVALVLFVSGAMAQKDLFTALKEFEGKEFRMYKISGSDADGYMVSRQYEDNTVLFKPVLVNNRFGKTTGFELAYTNKNDNTKDYSERYEGVDHYTHPAVTYTGLYKKTPDTDYGWLMIDSVIYRVDGLDAMDPTKIDIHYIWLPVLPKDETAKEETAQTETNEEGGKKKLSMKERLAAAKEKVANFAAGDPFIARQRNKKHGEVIINYINEMRKIQKANPYSAAIKKELEGLVADRIAYDADVKATNDAYWASEEGQAMKKRMAGNDANNAWVTVNNTGSNRMYVITEQGTVSWIAAGGNSKFKCNSNLYRCTTDGSGNHNQRGGMIYKQGSSCGGSISVQ
jgi:hypothetical protein